jgi:xylan 1,4-beta-xylosidase
MQHFKAEIKTCMEFEPVKFQQLAGLVLYYNTGHYHYLYCTTNGTDKILAVMSCSNFKVTEQAEEIIVTNISRLFLKAIVNHSKLQFWYSVNEIDFQTIGEELDMSILSDDFVREGSDRYRPAFTGSFAGICCQDLVTNNLSADFDWFEYQPL